MSVTPIEPNKDYLWKQSQGAAAYFNNQVWHVYAGSGDGTLKQIVLDPSKDLTDSSNWSSSSISSSQTVKRPQSDTPPALVPVRDLLYLIYLDNDKGKLSATCYDPVAKTWKPYLRITDNSGNYVYVDQDNSKMAAMNFNDEIIVTVTDTDGKNVYFYRLTPPATWPSDNAWAYTQKKSYSTKTLASSFQIQGLDDSYKLKRNVSIAWFPAVTQQTSGGETPPAPVNIMVQSLRLKEDDGDYHYFLLQWQLDQNGMPQTALHYDHKSEDAGGITVTRDPAGRIRIYYQNGGDIKVNTLNAIPATLGTKPTFNWLGGSYLNGELHSSYYTPVATFMPKPSTVSTQGSDTDVEVDEIVFYCKDDSDNSKRYLRSQIAKYGTLRKVVQANGPLNLTDDTKNVAGQGDSPQPASSWGRWQVLGYIDGPPPFPNVNVADNPDQKYSAQVTYGKTQTSSTTHQVDVSLTVGMTSSGTASMGGGIAWDTSFHAGTGSKIGGTETTETSKELFGSYGKSGDAVAGQGTVFARPIILLRDEYQFIDPGQSQPSSSAPTWATFYLKDDGNEWQAVPYDVFTVTPGDLDSYSEASWDAKMGAGYFENHILPNAIDLDPDLQDPSNTSEPALDFSYGATGGTNTSSAATSTSFTERSWKFDASLYAGVSSKIDAWGVGWESTAMVGFSTEAKTLNASQQSVRWGIDVDQALPRNPNETNPDAVLSFAWKLYLVSASTEWAQELYNHLPSTSAFRNAIDLSSACWKIVYTVNPDRIVTVGTSTAQLMSTHGLSTESYRTLRERGIRTAGQLVRDLGIDDFGRLEEQVRERLAKKAA